MDVSSVIFKLFSSEQIYPLPLFEKTGKVYSFINPYGYHLLRKNYGLYDRLDGLYVDGILMCVLCKMLYGLKISRRSFDNTTVAKDLFAYLSTTGKTVYFVGAKRNEIEKAIEEYKKNYPQMHISGFRSGYFLSDRDYRDCIYNILIQKPDFVVVGMGAILQEKFLLDLKDAGFEGIGFTCGGFIRQSSNGINYFPKWIDKYHLRSFYRLYKEKETRKRLYNLLIQYPFLFLYDRFFYIKSKKNLM